MVKFANAHPMVIRYCLLPVAIWMMSYAAQAQRIPTDSLACTVIENDKFRLAGRPFVHTAPFFFSIYNAKKQYAAFQLGKRRSDKLFLYVKVFAFNACINKKYTVTLRFADTSTHMLENNYDPNCEGIFIREFTRRDIKALAGKLLIGFMLQTYDKDYEFRVNGANARRIREDVLCLKTYTF